jgi:predicted nucleic acid-binding protein
MRYVLDSSVALKWVLPEADSAKALALRADSQKGIHELLAPDIIVAEVAHAIARAERRKILTPPEGTLRLADLLNTLPRVIPFLPLIPRAFTIASQTRSGAYDCVYVALAEREGCQLVTADDKLFNNLRGESPFLVSLASLP